MTTAAVVPLLSSKRTTDGTDGNGKRGSVRVVREKDVQNEILRTFATRPDLRLWRANVGVARVGKRVVRFGIVGQADLSGILPGGVRLEIECKSATGEQRKEQRWFQEMIEKFGGCYVLARSVDDVWEALRGYGIEKGRNI